MRNRNKAACREVLEQGAFPKGAPPVCVCACSGSFVILAILEGASSPDFSALVRYTLKGYTPFKNQIPYGGIGGRNGSI